MRTNPFPGMNPWLELHWGDVHHSLIQYGRDDLQALLPEDLLARVEERIYVDDEHHQSRHIIPDVMVYQIHPWPTSVTKAEGGVAIANPLVFELSVPEITEGYIEIRDRGGKIITVIEFLS